MDSNKIYQVAVIGVGQLGNRHLQGLYGLSDHCILYMVDPVPNALDRARVQLKDASSNCLVHKIVACTELAELPDELDLAIVATTSEVRLPVLEKLLARCEVKRLILEKILFTREDEYERAQTLLDSRDVTAWVNCPRRMYEIYRQVREFFSDIVIHHMQVYGCGWGLGCNGIHFVDLLNYLTGVVVEEYDTGLLDPSTYPSKRRGFVEFGGTLIGRTGSTQLWLTDSNESYARHIITLRGQDRSCLIDELGGKAWFLVEREGWRSISFNIPYQSQLTGEVAMRILETGASFLPNYRTSAAIHLPFIRALTRHYIETSDSTAVVCPIT